MVISRGMFKYLQITMVVAISISITSRGNHESDVNPFAMASQKVLLGVGLLSLG